MARTLAATITQVKREIAAQRFDQADRLLRKALSADPDAPELHEQRGLVAYGRGDPSAAMEAMNAAVALAPFDGNIRFSQLRIVTSLDDSGLTRDIALAAVTAAPNDDRLLRMAAKAFTKLRDFALAGKLLRRLGERTDDVASIVEAARLLVAARDYTGALDCTEEALRRDPSSDGAKVQRLRALERSQPNSAAFGQAVVDAAEKNVWEALEHLPYLLCYGLDEALAALVLACCHQGIRIDPVLAPPTVEALEAAARRFEERKRIDDADRCRMAIGFVESGGATASDEVEHAIALSLQDLRDGAEAAIPGIVERLRSILAVQTTHSVVWKDVAETLETRRNWNEAARAWLGYAAGLPAQDRTPALRQADAAFRNVASAEDRLALFGEARSLDSSSATAAEGVAQATRDVADSAAVAMSEGRLSDAASRVALIRRWADKDPAGAELTKRLLSQLRADMRDADKDGRVSDAAEVARLQIDIDPACVPALRHLARDAMREQRSQDAVALYRRLLEIDPEGEEYAVKLGQAYRRLRRYDDGLAVIRRLLERQPDHPTGRELLARLLDAKESKVAAPSQ